MTDLSPPQEYNDPLIAEVVVRKTERAARDMASHPPPASDSATLLMAILAAREGADAACILDIGGAAGIHCFVFRRAFPHVPVRWAVVETPAMVERARTLEGDGLRFFTSVEAARTWLGKLDVINCSGSIQYMPEPEHTLEQLLGLRARYVAISRLPLLKVDRETRIETSRLADNGPGPLPPGLVDIEVHYPVTIMSRESFLGILSVDYRLLATTDAKPSGFEKDGRAILQYSYLFSRN